MSRKDLVLLFATCIGGVSVFSYGTTLVYWLKDWMLPPSSLLAQPWATEVRDRSAKYTSKMGFYQSVAAVSFWGSMIAVFIGCRMKQPTGRKSIFGSEEPGRPISYDPSVYNGSESTDSAEQAQDDVAVDREPREENEKGSEELARERADYEEGQTHGSRATWKEELWHDTLGHIELRSKAYEDGFENGRKNRPKS